MTVGYTRPLLFGSVALLLVAAERLLNIALLPPGTEPTSRALFALGFGTLATLGFVLAYLTRRGRPPGARGGRRVSLDERRRRP